MEWLKDETDLGPLRPVLVFRQLLPRGRLHLQQIKRKLIVGTPYEKNERKKSEFTNVARDTS